MLYFDTSCIVPLIAAESSSAAMASFVARLPTSELATSHWTRVEFASFLARQLRVGKYNKGQANAAAARFASIVPEPFDLILPTADDYDRAALFLQHYETGLRGPDALHLAIAANRQAEAIYTLDRGLLRAGRLLGLPVGTGVALPGYET